MSTIRFELRTDKANTDGACPVRVVYQIQGQRKYIPTGVKVHPGELDEKTGDYKGGNWSIKQQQVIYGKGSRLMKSEVDKFNGQLFDLKRQIEKIEQRFEANGIVYNGQMVLDELATANKPKVKRDASSKELFAFIDRYIETHRHQRKKGSLSVYKSLKQHLEGYEQKTRSKIGFNEVNKAFFESFRNYLLSLIKTDKQGNKTKLLSNSTIAKQLSTLKTLLNYAREHNIEVPQFRYKVVRDQIEDVIALTKDEFHTLYSLNLSAKPSLERVRDIFCLSCATGLRYSDLKQLRPEHVKTDYIDLIAVKTSHKTKIPLNPYSRAVLAKYNNELPVISNQKSNKYLEQACKLAGIDEKIEIVRGYGAERVVTVYPKYELVRMHSGRKTFATLSLENGMPAEYVMKIGGWKDYKSFKRYINVTDESAKAAMQQAWGGKVIKTKLKAV